MTIANLNSNNIVLCWLATSSISGQPNVSPKEIFCLYGEEHLLIANIASPGSERNIRENPAVCVSFIDILVQKGAQVKGVAEVVVEGDEAFADLAPGLTRLTGGKFPFRSIFKIRIGSVKPIIAPRYRLFPDTTEAEQVASARLTYGLEEQR